MAFLEGALNGGVQLRHFAAEHSLVIEAAGGGGGGGAKSRPLPPPSFSP